MIRDLLHLLFPRKCPGCAKELVRQEGEVCLECLSEIRPTHFHKSPDNNELYNRLAGKVPINSAAALFYFDKTGRLKKIVEALKYRNNPQVGRYLGEFWAEQISGTSFFTSADVLVPVPLHRKRQKERGYNQATEIARGLALHNSAKVIESALVRSTATSSQTRKGKQERWENVRDVFEMREPLTGHLILVDDVVTTGSTLEACVRTLLAQPVPPLSIGIMTLGMAHQH